MDLWSSTEPKFNGRMLILAREARGITQKQLAGMLNVPQSRISMIEMDLRPVHPELLDQFVHTLHYPQTFFYQRSSLAGVGVSEVFHRKRARVAKGVLEGIYAQIEIRFLHLQALLRSVDVEPTVPQMDLTQFDGQVAEIARSVRAHWAVPRGPIEALVDLLEDAGVIVIPFEFGTHDVDAISRWAVPLPPTMFINVGSPMDRLRFSLAHELGHLVMHELPTPDMEAEADAFAAEFLMPERDIRHELQGVDLARLAVLKKYWRVSMAALLTRAKTLETITSNQARYLWAQMSQAGYRVREPVELDPGTEQTHLVRELIDVHTTQLGYTADELSQVLCLERDEFAQQYLRSSQGGRPSLHAV